MPFAGYPLDTNRTNLTGAPDRHPLDHNQERTALNDLQGQVSALQAQIAAIGGWTSYTPVLSGAGWALGSTGASATGAYHVVNGLVHFYGHAQFGTVGATFGAGIPSISLPVTAIVAGTVMPISTEYADASAGFGIIYGAGLLASSTFGCYVTHTASTYAGPFVVSNTAPFTWAASDIIRFAGSYRAA